MSGTWLFVHSGDVDLKGSNVGHQEGQTAPMEHLGGGDGTLTSVAVPTSHSITKSSGVVSKKRSKEETDLYLYDFIEEDLWIFLKLKLEVLWQRMR